MKHERADLHTCDSVAAASAEIADYFAWYNLERHQSSRQDQTPEQADLALLPKPARAT